jgi:MFS transporter, DHA2 family, multidrug resistance protein
LGTSILIMFTRKAEQVHSNLIGRHVVAGEPMTDDRVMNYAQIVGASTQGTGGSEARALGLLSNAVREQAYTLSILDGFLLAGAVGTLGVLLVVCLLEPPKLVNPAAPPTPPLPPPQNDRDTAPHPIHPAS